MPFERAGRPRGTFGEKTRAVWMALKDRPMTRTEVRANLLLSDVDARNALNRLKQAGWISITDQVATGRRPASVYAARSEAAHGPQLDILFRNFVRG